MRESKVDASAVLKLFQFDHIVLHSFGGSDEWWNLDPKQVADHKIKSRRDTAIAAKAKRIDPKWQEFTRAIAAGKRPPRRLSRWPKRKFYSGFKSVKISHTSK